ncbi:MAG TPA: hypothetical protein VMX35_06645 [Acidobacteriota bacterium]|nr:hypothetical protein [Acidobacteriota bacterium]
MRESFTLVVLLAVFCITTVYAAQDDAVTSHFKSILQNKQVRLKMDVLSADDLQFGERENHTFFDTEGAYYLASFFSSASEGKSKMVTIKEYTIQDLLNRLKVQYPLYEDKRYVTVGVGTQLTVSVVAWDGNGALAVGLTGDEGLSFIYFEFGDIWKELGSSGMEEYVRKALAF